jgi:hypothetical protein
MGDVVYLLWCMWLKDNTSCRSTVVSWRLHTGWRGPESALAGQCSKLLTLLLLLLPVAACTASVLLLIVPATATAPA